MLDTETKRRIDTARDILVGKVPDPKSQVEQITIALIYKFMDDMDAEAEELGGERTFFNGEFAQYGWAKLMSPAVGGYEMLNLYSEAITKMTSNQSIPPLFRDIFKNAYLPYHNPQTLKSFLKIIDDFEYDHSERLGDAFEYLLSVLGAQGDAGQFRTPRHIIDFMVAVIDPKKEESILDPACGTAGFLISAWKHILHANSKQGRKGAGLTPDQRKRLVENIKGYDISPDMVRLSLVNLYLHGFTDPHISEYDTLTSEDNWNEYSDIILANPPFMSPKGGIKPHKRFSIQAKRSEVLFVDYIAEHLTPTGRAAVIVPEGIIFQSKNAYKQLRKMLVENYLYAVVSLPSGVFQPYSGVKTSILLMDKTLAKKRDSILFVKVENDGFDLGKQRRKIEKNDLPSALKTIQEFIYMDVMYAASAGRAGAAIDMDVMYAASAGAAIDMDKQDSQDKKEKSCSSCPSMSNALIVEKEKIAENGEWNLSGERYRENDDLRIGNYELVELNQIVTTIAPPVKIQKKNFCVSGKYPIVDQSQKIIAGWTDDENSMITPSKPLVIFGDHTCVIKLIDKPFSQGADGIKILSTVDSVLPKYLYYYLKANPLESDGYKRHFTKLKKIKIPLPPLKIQQEIVAEIEGYQKIIDGARAVVDNYTPKIQINPDWEMVRLGEVLQKSKSNINPQNMVGVATYYGLENISQGGEEIGDTNTEYSTIKSTKTEFNIGDILYGKLRPNLNKVLFAETNGICSTDIFVLTAKDKWKTEPKFYGSYLRSDKFNFEVMKGIKGAQLPRVGWQYFSNILVPIPPLETQTEIVAQIEKEQSLVNANKELITLFEQKIKDKIAGVWGE